MPNTIITDAQVNRLKQAAKKLKKANTGLSLAQALDDVARKNGFSSMSSMLISTLTVTSM